MMQLSCKDMGQPDCGFVARGENVDDVVRKMTEHHQAVHGMKDEDLSPEKMDSMAAMVQEA